MRRYLAFILLFFTLTLRIYFVCGQNLKECSERKLLSSMPEFIEKTAVSMRKYATNNIRKFFPSPHSELLLGMVIGVDEFKLVPRFKEALKETGTIHIVVVSGYNISLVFDLVIRLIGTKYKLKNLLIAQFVTFIYSVLSGFEPPVVRAWIMGSIASWGKFYGRSVEALQVLIFSGLVMCVVNPLYIFSLSFQLSFMATLSLILYTTPITSLIARFSKKDLVFLSDLSTTLAAQVLVWPIISYYFGRISVISPIVNCLLLWTVPIATVLGGIFLFTSFLHRYLAASVFYLTFPPLDIFVEGIRFFSQFKIFVVDFKLNGFWLGVYYILVFAIPLIYKKFHKSTDAN